MRQNDIGSARRAIASLGQVKHLRRYPAALRAQLSALVRAHPEVGMASLARELDMAPATLRRIIDVATVPVVPVRVVKARRPSALVTTLIVRGPSGLVIEGLDVSGVAELIRALS